MWLISALTEQLEEGKEKEFRYHEHADESLPRLLGHPVEPLQGHPLHPHRRLLDLSDYKIKRRTNTLMNCLI